MIAEILLERCNGCNSCVVACPDHVFDRGPEGAPPVIARLEQCQTCFLCELYCPEDALYVAVGLPRAQLKEDPLGHIRRDYGWDGAEDDPLKNFWKLGPLLREGVQTSSARYARQELETPTATSKD
ncbi:4Fe-4S dicluster domain-containing protein [Acetobacter vaccinii]|uniref:Ferredoxin family protein n=1 Tax=Acetobacter vaccinii TaxID=2592655 RepID=A0A5C1YRB4_9PROT|nr:ferredoxin family protein [Acetobacter vaccinii]QEO18185.1 ferredoxin family protein [Acetobacter vaccinii]